MVETIYERFNRLRALYPDLNEEQIKYIAKSEINSSLYQPDLVRIMVDHQVDLKTSMIVSQVLNSIEARIKRKLQNDKKV